jgi:hypothetical protein
MNKLLAYIGYFFVIINFILLLKSFSRNEKAFKFFFIYHALMLVIQIFTEILILRHINNLFLSHFYFILQFILLSFFYLNILKEKNQIKLVKLFLFLCLFALTIQYSIDNSLFFKFNLFEITITSLSLVLYSGFHLYNMLGGKKNFYYINLGVLIYLFSSTILFLFGNYISTLKSDLSNYLYSLNSFLYIVYQLFILYDLKKNYITKEVKHNANEP